VNASLAGFLTEGSQTEHLSQGSIVESKQSTVLHRPVELAAVTGKVGLGASQTKVP
jgi:hypothetical protein